MTHPHRSLATKRSDRRSHGVGRRILAVVSVGVVIAGMISLFTGSTSQHVVPPPPPQSIARMHSDRLLDYASESAIVQATQARDKALVLQRNGETETVPVVVEPIEIPRDTNVRVPVASFEIDTDRNQSLDHSTPRIRITQVRSVDPHPTRDQSMIDALTVARDRIALELRLLDPPLDAVPTLDQVRTEMIRRGSIVEIQPTTEQKEAWKAANLDADRVWIEFDIELTEQQIRGLRSSERFQFAILIFAAAFIAVLAINGFLRLDTWTKGHLTKWLGIGIGAVAGIAIVLLFLLN